MIVRRAFTVINKKGLDKEKNRTTIVMCGLTSEGICTWAKKEEIKYQELV